MKFLFKKDHFQSCIVSTKCYINFNALEQALGIEIFQSGLMSTLVMSEIGTPAYL